MKILHTGWWKRPYRGGGLIIYAESLMQQQVYEGHEVHYFCGGRYNLLSSDSYLKKYNSDGIKIHEIVNPDNLIWSSSGIKNHLSSKNTERHFEELLLKINPDVVHIQELESLSAGIIDICKRHNFPTIMSLHNYWPLCPQRDLIDNDFEVCTDYRKGHKCMTCNVLPNSSRLSWMIVALMYDYKIPKSFLNFARDLYLNYSKYFFTEKSGKVNEQYFTQRRHEFIKRLNMIKLLAVSEKVRKIYIDYGVDKENIKTVHISSRAIDFIKRKELETPKIPMRFGYTGNIEPHKGVHVLIKAFKKLDQSKCSLNIYGVYGKNNYTNSLIRESRHYNIRFYGRYGYEQLNNILDKIDVGIAPQIWDDNSPQVVIEMLQAGIPVIGSNIGGIPDFIKNNKNGFLFEPGNVSELRDKLEYFVNNPDKVLSFSKNIQPHITLEQHSSEIIDYYNSIM